MAEKRTPGQRLNPKKSKQDTGKYLQAVEAWIGEADKLEENYEDIPVVGNLQNNTTNNTKLGSGKAGKGKKGKGFDEVNDNINVDGMLMNIMDALKEEPQHKAETKKRVYSPLQRAKKVAPEPDVAKPAQNSDLLNSSSNLKMGDADKSIKNQSPFSVDYEPKPFAKAFFPSSKIANDPVHDNTAQIDQRVMQVNGTTLGDLSAIAPESIVKELLDSRGSLPNFLGSNPKLGLNQEYDQVLSPILSPVPFLQSPNKVQNNLTESQNPPSGRFIEKKGSGDSQNPLWSHMVTELETEPAVESNLSKQKAEINKKEEKKDRRAKAIDLLAMLAADEELGNVKEDDKKTKSKLGANSKLKKRNTRVLTKKKIQKINEEYEADKALEEEQARAEERFSPSPTLGPSPGASPLAQREDWHFLLGNETPEPRIGQSRDGRLNDQPTQSLIGRPVDETRDTALFREGNRPGSGMSNIFISDGSGNAVGFHKEFAKTNILLDTIESSPTHLLKKKNKPEKIEVYEEEGPLSVEFIKRGFDTEEDSFIFEHDDPKDLIERPKRTKTIVDTDEFDIPISKGLINFFVGFTRRAAKLNYLVQEVRKPDYTLDTFFERNFTFFKGKLQITKNFFFLFVLLTGIMLYFIIDTLAASDLSRVKNDDRKDFLSKFFIPGAIIFTYYGIAFLYIPKKWLRLIVAAQLIPCGLIFLIDIGNTYVADHSFPYESVFICGYIIALNVFWAITRAIRQDILTNYSWAMSMVFMTCWCILMPTAILAYSVYLSVTSRRFNYDWAHEMTIHIGIPTMFLLCFTWVYYHFRFFVGIKKVPEKKAANQQSAASVTKEAEERLKEQFEDDSDYDDYKKEEKKPSLKLRIYNSVQSLIKRLSDTVVVASSLSLGGSMIFVEGLILAYLYNTTLDKTDEELSGSVYLGVFLYFLIPITILFGVPIVATSKHHEKKMIIVPIVAVLFPLFVTMPISYTMISDDDDDGSYILGLFLVLAPTAATVFWLTVSYFGLKKKKTKFSLLSFLFIFFVFPLLVLQPLISVDGFGDLKTARVFFAIFLAIGIIILIIIIAYLICRSLLIKEMIQQDRLNTDNYKLMGIFKTDLSPFGYWSNSLGFIVNFTISLFTLFHAPELVPGGEKGLTLGFAICFVVFYAYNIIVLQLQVIKPTEISNFGIKSLSAGIIESVRNNELYEEMQKIRDTTEKIKNYLRVFSVFLALLFLILALGLASDSFKSHLFSSLAIGTVLSHVIFEIHAAIKVKYANISQAVIPISFTYIWFTLVLAFPAILQLARVFFFDKEDRKKRMQFQLIVAAIVITVSVIAVIANIIFKGIELSQKIRYVLAYVRKQLEGIAVKSDYFVLQRVFEGWMENGERLLKKSLINRGKPAFWWPIPATNPNTKYSKVLLDFDAYKYMKLRLKAKLENEHADGINTKKKPYKRSFINNCLEFLGLCIPSLFNKKKIVPLDEELNEEIEELLDLEMYDVPLPPKDEDEESDEDEDEDAWDLGDWQIESKIAENKIEINEAVFKPLDDYVLRAMMYYDSGVKFAHNDAWTVDFLKFVFQLFAVGNYKFFKKRWMDYLGYKRFMILAAITPSAEFPDYIMDLVYATYTHNVGKGQIQRRIDYSNKKMEAKKKMKKNPKEEERDQKLKLKVFPVFEEDFEGFLVHIAKRRFPNEINDRDALYRLIRWHLFPNFLHLLPSLQKQYPHEYDYLRYLVDLILSRQKKSTFEQTIEINIRGSNSSSPIKANENPNNSKDAFDPNREDEEIGGTNCLSAMCGCAYSLFANFFKFIFKNIGLILTNFFFLKTYEQKQADEEFDEMQQKADREEREQVQKIREDKAAETNLGDNPSLLEEGLNKQGIFRRKRKTYPHKPSPEWPVIAETMIRALKHAENDYETKKLSRKQPNFVLNIRNILTLLARMIEIYSLASLAFRLEISWDWLYPIQNVVSFPSATTSAYTYKIWTSLGFSVFYWYVGIISIEFAKEGVLGADKATMKAGEFPSRSLTHSQILNYFSTALSVWIIRTFLDAFSCDYKQSIHTLFFVPSVECYSSDHYWLILIAGVGLILYYPVASFLYPNLQYLNLGNDIKHDTSSVVLFNQAKLIIIALHVFFPYSNEALIPLIISAVIWIALAIINNILKPNTISILNVWETSFYFMGAWAQISSIIMYFTKNSNLSTALLLIGLVIILLITMLVHRIHKSAQVSEPVAETSTAPSKPVEKKEKKSDKKNKRKLETKESFSPLISHHRTELDLSGMKTLQNIENQTMIKPVDLTKSGILDISANI